MTPSKLVIKYNYSNQEPIKPMANAVSAATGPSELLRIEQSGAVLTVGLNRPVWAAAADEECEAAAGTINIVAFLPVRHTDAALANLLCTVTEAKVQALVVGGVDGSGTASDAVTILCPADGPAEPFGGPRSRYGSRVARAVFAALQAGMARP